MTVPPPQHVNVFFRLATVAGGVFVVTILAYLATTFGDPRAPIHGFLARNAGRLFAGEALAVIVFGVLGMAVDRRQTLRHRASLPAAEAAAPMARTDDSESPTPASSSGAPPADPVSALSGESDVPT